MIGSRGLVALVALAALSLTACTNNDADAGDVVDAMSDAGLDQDQAECMGQEFEKAFDQDQMNDLAAADNPDDFPSGTKPTVDSIIEDCTGETVPGSEASDSEGQDGESETTTTTAADGN
jgi:predicted small secreted protein